MGNYLYIHNHFLDIKNSSDIYSSLVLLCDAIGTSGFAGYIVYPFLEHIHII